MDIWIVITLTYGLGLWVCWPDIISRGDAGVDSLAAYILTSSIILELLIFVGVF